MFVQAYVVQDGINLIGNLQQNAPNLFHEHVRPFVDDVIVPSTWFDAGAGIHGEIGQGLRYRTYVMAPLDASGFTAEEGIRDGRQKGAEANVRNIATTGRVEYVGLPGLWAGASLSRVLTTSATFSGERPMSRMADPVSAREQPSS